MNTCHGTGVEKETVTRKIRIPSGVETGQRLIVRDGGDAGKMTGCMEICIYSLLSRNMKYLQEMEMISTVKFQ